MPYGDRRSLEVTVGRAPRKSSQALRSSVEKSPTPCGAFPHGAMQQTPHMPAMISLQTPLNTGLSLCEAEMRR